MSEFLSQSPTTEFVRSVTESTEKVDRIREILWGASMREYAQQLASNKHEVMNLHQEIGRLNAQLEEQDKNLRDQMCQENARLCAQLQETEQRHAQQLQNLDQQHRQRIQQLSEQIQRNEQTVLDQLSQLTTRLDHAKADRGTLGELLIDLGENLKSNAPVPLTKVTDLLEQLRKKLQLRKETLRGRVSK